MKMSNALKKILNIKHGKEVVEHLLDTDTVSSDQHTEAEDGWYTDALCERIKELEERCNTYLDFVERLRSATLVVRDIAEFGLKKECVAAIDNLYAMVVEVQENMLWCCDIDNDDDEVKTMNDTNYMQQIKERRALIEQNRNEIWRLQSENMRLTSEIASLREKIENE